ncbi:ribonuclease H-like domain-containing protein [Tanacetum coccineum]
MRDHVNDRFDEFDIKRRDFEMASSHDFHEIEEVLQEDRDKAISFDPVKEPLDFERTKNTYSPCLKADKRDWNGLMSKKMGLGYGFTKKACFVCGSFSHLIRDCDFHEKRMAKQVELNKQKVNAARQNPSSQAAKTSTARKVNTAIPIMCDKKNKVLFTDSECLVLSPDFKDIIEFCGSKRIKREYSNARTPQQNGVAKRKNKTLIEDARTMLADSFLSNTFLAEAVSTAGYGP